MQFKLIEEYSLVEQDISLTDIKKALQNLFSKSDNESTKKVSEILSKVPDNKVGELADEVKDTYKNIVVDDETKQQLVDTFQIQDDVSLKKKLGDILYAVDPVTYLNKNPDLSKNVLSLTSKILSFIPEGQAVAPVIDILVKVVPVNILKTMLKGYFLTMGSPVSKINILRKFKK